MHIIPSKTILTHCLKVSWRIGGIGSFISGANDTIFCVHSSNSLWEVAFLPIVACSITKDDLIISLRVRLVICSFFLLQSFTLTRTTSLICAMERISPLALSAMTTDVDRRDGVASPCNKWSTLEELELLDLVV